MKLVHYSGLITKTRAMSGKLLEQKQLHELTELATVGEAVNFLKGTTGYEEVFQGHEGIWHRGQAEAVIRNSLYQDFEKLYRFSNKEQRLAFRYVFFRYEADLLKRLVKHLFRGERQELEKYSDVFFKEHAGFPIEQARRAKDMGELEQCLAGTKYETLFMQLRNHERGRYADYAMGLDLFYYDTVFREIRRMKPSDMKSVLLQIYGTRIDWLNIMWVYRSKRFYDQTPQEITAWMIPHSYLLKKKERELLANAADLEELNRILEHTGYFKGKDAFVRMEDEISYRKVIEDTYARVTRKYPVSMAPVMKYIHEKEMEIGRLTTIIEGIRYQVAPRDIKDFILITI
ncbi:MAG: V-type ATPase subunit [Lachnospiraceae bacterium]|jgi:V/A-type H+-transporting ATPase subunit C|nr:V-type ATPase subunit [Lachnospiraceae bacterium]